MADIRDEGDMVMVRFSIWEALVMGREMVAVPVATVTSVELLPGWTSEVLGVRFGVVVSGHLKVGTFVHPDGTRRLVAMRRGAPLLRIRLRDRVHGYDELLVSSTDAAEVSRWLQPRVTA